MGRLTSSQQLEVDDQPSVALPFIKIVSRIGHDWPLALYEYIRGNVDTMFLPMRKFIIRNCFVQISVRS